MRKRTWSIALAGALIASLFVVAPVSAQDAEPQDAEPFACGQLFTDPAEDVSEENLDLIGGGVAATDDAGFTAELQVRNLTKAIPVDATGNVWYFLWNHADTTYFASATISVYSSDVVYSLGTLGDTFTTTGTTEGSFNEGEAGTITILVPYEAVGGVAPGDLMSAAYGDSRVRLSGPAGPGAVAPIDRGPDEGFGTDFTAGTCAGEAPAEGPPADEEPPAVDDDDGTTDEKPKAKKNCKKKKTKKARKKCMKKQKKNKGPKAPGPGAGCTAYVPGDEGAEFETAVVTDEHTEEAPLEVTISAPVGMGSDLGVGLVDNTESTFHNIQLDTAGAEGGLYVRYEFPEHNDLDLYLNYADGSEAAHSGAFNQAPLPVLGLDGTGAGGHGGVGFEQLDGIRTADCAGYTARLSSYLTEGGDMTLKLWVGEILNDPTPPGDEG